MSTKKLTVCQINLQPTTDKQRKTSCSEETVWSRSLWNSPQTAGESTLGKICGRGRF